MGSMAATADDSLYGEDGNDSLIGGAGVDWLERRARVNDTLFPVVLEMMGSMAGDGDDFPLW